MNRPHRTLWAIVRTFALSRWELRRVLSRGGRRPDLGPHDIPLAACGEWTLASESGGGKESWDFGSLPFEGGAIEFADVGCGV